VFPIKVAIRAAIAHDDAGMVRVLLEAYIEGYDHPNQATLNQWLVAVGEDDASTDVLDALLRSRPSYFRLGFRAMVALCGSADYQLVYNTFSMLHHPAHPSSAQHPLHIAVRSGHVASVQGIVNTGKFDVNAQLTSNIYNYSAESITALDVAAYHESIRIMYYLVSVNGLPSRRPAIGLHGRVYKILRIADMQGHRGSTSYPPFEDYKNMRMGRLDLALYAPT